MKVVSIGKNVICTVWLFLQIIPQSSKCWQNSLQLWLPHVFEWFPPLWCEIIGHHYDQKLYKNVTSYSSQFESATAKLSWERYNPPLTHKRNFRQHDLTWFSTLLLHLSTCCYKLYSSTPAEGAALHHHRGDRQHLSGFMPTPKFDTSLYKLLTWQSICLRKTADIFKIHNLFCSSGRTPSASQALVMCTSQRGPED